MSLRSAALVVVILAGTAVFAQENAPASASAATAVPGATNPPTATYQRGRIAKGNAPAGPVNAPSLQQRIDELQGTLDKMHTVLKQMRTKSSATAKDSMVKANLDMWQLMVGQLDNQLQELKQAEANRQDMEARRAAMYKQAEIKSQAAAKAAQEAMFSRQPTGTVTTQPPVQGPNGSTPAPGQAPAPSSSANTSVSPN